MSLSGSPGRWNGPFYRAGTEHFDASFVPKAGEPLDAVDNIDVEVTLRDGSRWSATIFTLAEVGAIMERWAASGEALGGRFFACSDGLIVRDAGIANMVEVLVGLYDRGELTQVLQRLDDV